MTENHYDNGDLVRVYGTFTDPLNSDAAIDPTAVMVSVRDPSGNVDTYTYGDDASVMNSDVGEYYYDVDVDEPGRWYYRWYSTGTGQAAGEGAFTARRAYAS